MTGCLGKGILRGCFCFLSYGEVVPSLHHMVAYAFELCKDP